MRADDNANEGNKDCLRNKGDEKEKSGGNQGFRDTMIGFPKSVIIYF